MINWSSQISSSEMYFTAIAFKNFLSAIWFLDSPSDFYNLNETENGINFPFFG